MSQPTYGLEFNGVDNYAVSASTIAFTGDWTLECWFRTTIAQPNGAGLVSIADNWISNGAFLNIAGNSGDYVYVQAPSGGARATNTGHVFDGLWHHAAVSFTHSTSKATVFLDGVPGTAATTSPGNPTSKVTLGSSPGGPFVGDIQQVRVSNNVRYTTDFSASLPTAMSVDGNTLAFWSLNQKSGTTATNGGGSAGALTLTNGGHGLPTWISDDLIGSGFGDGTYNAVFTPGAGLNSFPSWVSGSPSRYLYATGGSDTAISLNGSNQYGLTASMLALTSGDFTVEAWINTTSLNAEFAAVVSMADNWGTSGWELNVNSDNDDQVSFRDFNGAIANYNCDNIGGSVVFDGQWHHIAVDYNHTSGVATVYLDGQADNDDTDSNGGGEAVVSPYTTSKISIGASVQTGTPADFFAGVIDEVRISNTRRYTTDSFTPSRNLGTDASTLVYYKFSEGSGTSVADTSGNGKTLTLTGSPSWVGGVTAASLNYYLGSSLANNGAGAAAYDANHANNLLPDGAYAADQSATGGTLSYYFPSTSSSSSSSSTRISLSSSTSSSTRASLSSSSSTSSSSTAASLSSSNSSSSTSTSSSTLASLSSSSSSSSSSTRVSLSSSSSSSTRVSLSSGSSASSSSSSESSTSSSLKPLVVLEATAEIARSVAVATDITRTVTLSASL